MINDKYSEEIEGMELDEDDSLGEYPIDTVLIRNENRTVYDVIRRISQGGYVMDPDFQRDFIWDEEKQSKLIESVLMRIPLPVFYLAENKQGHMIVVDGLQRLSTFQRFCNDELKLKLPNQKLLHGKRFKDLSPKLQNRVEDCNLILYLIDPKVPTQALLDIFDRVNSGEPLSRQQMRNCLFMGPATQLLREKAAKNVFKEVTGGSLKPEKMRDRELINRFFAFKCLGVAEYRGGMDDFLERSLETINKMCKPEIIELADSFDLAMANNLEVFGKHAFRKHTDPHHVRSVINASLWDVMSVTLSNYPESLIRDKAELIREGFYELMTNYRFIDAITLGTNQVGRVKERFRLVQKMFEEIME
ncbi:DUF262 domain-containing protein [Rheinheimera metallidurans]|uniref:DUF262 domain-containing protein n=1 Tax=Rheinheimera metallidurans TaxID=2925781 RepID=UPI0030029841